VTELILNIQSLINHHKLKIKSEYNGHKYEYLSYKNYLYLYKILLEGEEEWIK
jgi:hypothetical protein